MNFEDIKVRVRGFIIAVSYDEEEGDWAFSAQDAASDDARDAAADVSNSYWAWRAASVGDEMRGSYIYPQKRLIEWLRGEYGEDAVTFRVEEDDSAKERVY